MEYVMSSKWSLMPRFEITDGSGAPQYEARGHLGSQITLHDNSGQEVADIRKHVFSDTHEVFKGGQQVAQVRHAGIFGDRYDIESAYGVISARGHFAGGDYTLSRAGVPVARMVRQFSLREKFAVDVSDEEDQLFFLAVVLAIEAIHEERNGQEHRGGIPGLGGGIGGLLGGTGL
jgi:uncharacterized protein YxjI